MPFQHWTPARQSSSCSHYSTKSSSGWDSRAFKIIGENGEEEEEKFVEEEEYDGTKVAPAPLGASEGSGGPTVAQYNWPFSHQNEPYLLGIMQQMTQIMANLQADSRPPAFKTPSMKEPDCFYGTQHFKARSFIQ
ncbi:hypothetical protein O181_070267 [Austropuccinia psidii MF-1]|uniref:Uncharacterized protein n=1 Tax=Austropuccinia psidii MF-1 TaxID=1389203 RepID=A0A9Q3F5M4_9BASI|nr:hypothetical protein [Austropuccinia psidii MF-1]